MNARRWLVAARVLPLVCVTTCVVSYAATTDPLPSWNEGPAKARIVQFVHAVTDARSPDLVPAADRIAVFDNDGTLWCEQPMYVQVEFMLHQLEAAAPQHPEWKDNAAFKAIAAHDKAALADIGQKPIMQLLEQASSGMTVEEYDHSIREWLQTARHPKYHRPYTELVYRPMQELLAYLRANGFRTFIVSGGSAEFMRPWTQTSYGIPPEQVVGSITDVKFEMRDGTPVLVREADIAFVDDGAGKPVGIYRAIGHRPIAAFGNSDGDQQMLEITAAGSGLRLMALVHHDDPVRETAYDRQSKIGRLDKAWNEAVAKGWLVVSMRSDWRRVFAFEFTTDADNAKH